MCDEPPLKVVIFFDSQTKLFFALHSLQKNECYAILLYLNIRGHYKEHKK